MSRRQARELLSRLTILYIHLLKTELQPDRAGHSWALTIQEQRRAIRRLIANQPSLRSTLPQAHLDAFNLAVRYAADETGTPAGLMPETPPFSLESALNSQPAPEAER